MPYSGPTFLPQEDITRDEQRRYDDLVKATPVPSAPIRTSNELDAFDEMVQKTPLPSQHFRGQRELEDFESRMAQTTLPSQTIAPSTPTPADVSTNSYQFPAEQVEPPVPVAPAVPSVPPAPVDQSSVGRTLTYLSGLGDDNSPQTSQGAPGGLGAAEEYPGGPLVGEGVFRPNQPAFDAAGMSSGAGRSVGGSFGAGASVGGSFANEQDNPLDPALNTFLHGTPEERATRRARMDAGGPVFTPEEAAKEMGRAEPYAMALTGEPLKNAGTVVSGLLDAAGNPIRAAAGEVRPILDELGNIAKEVKVRAPKEEIPHPEFLQPEAKLAPTHVPFYRQVFDRTRNVIASMGEGGKELAGRVHAWRESAETAAAADIQRMPTVDKLKPAAFTNMVDVLEGKAQPLNPQIAQAASEAKGVLDDLFSRAENAGVDVAERMGNYFPHTYKEDVVTRLRDVKKRGEAIRHLMETGQAGDEAEAIDKLSRFATTARNRRHGSLEMERLANLPGYEKTKEALYNHVLSANRRVAEVAQFGRDDAIKDRLVTRMTAEGFEGDLANDLFKTIVGAKTYSKAAEDISRVARTWHTATRLGLSAISNATQSANTASVTGLVKTLQAMPKAAWSPAEKEFAASTGVTLDSIIKEVREGAGWSDRIPGLLLPGFNQVEQFNRRVAAIAGRDFALDMAKKAVAGSGSATRALEKLGLDAEGIVRRGGQLSSREEISAARSIVERTQFRVDPQDLPQWTSHPIGRMASQFKTFAYNQSAFVQRELVDEVKKGNVLPIVRFAILAPLAQAAATETRNVLSGRAPEEDPGMRALQYALGPLGMVGDVSRTLFGINSKYVPVERRTAQFVGSLAGPTAGTVTEGLGAGLNLLEGKATPAARLALRQVPLAGSMLANRLTPYKLPADDTRPGRADTSRPDVRRNERQDTRR